MKTTLLSYLKIFVVIFALSFLFNSCSEDSTNDTGEEDNTELSVDNLTNKWTLYIATYNQSSVVADYLTKFGIIDLAENGNCTVNNFPESWSLDVSNKTLVVGEFTFTDVDFNGTTFSCNYIDNEGQENKNIALKFRIVNLGS